MADLMAKKLLMFSSGGVPAINWMNYRQYYAIFFSVIITYPLYTIFRLINRARIKDKNENYLPGRSQDRDRLPASY